MIKLLVATLVFLVVLPIIFLIVNYLIGIVFTLTDTLINLKVSRFSIRGLYEILAVYVWLLFSSASYLYLAHLNYNHWFHKVVAFMVLFSLFLQTKKVADKLHLEMDYRESDNRFLNVYKSKSYGYLFKNFQTVVYTPTFFVIICIWPGLINYIATDKTLYLFDLLFQKLS